MSGTINTWAGSLLVARWAGPGSCSSTSTFSRVAKIVHGNEVNAELFPWHFRADSPRTTLRFVEELDRSSLIVSVFAGLQHEACEFVALVAQQLVFSDPIDFLFLGFGALGVVWA